MAETVFNEGSIDGTDFRIESDGNANMLFVDGSSNRVGVGTSSPAGLLEIENTSGNANVYITSADASNSRLYLGHQSDAGHGFIDYDHDTAMYFGTDGTTRLTLTEAGRLGIGITSSINAKLHINETTSGQELIFLNHSVTGANQTYIQFRHDGSQRGNIQVNDSNDQIVYNTSISDKRLKKDFEEWDESVLPAFKSLKPQLFNFINSENKSGKTKGYIAQDNVENFPEAYTTSKILDDETEYYSFNPSGMVAYLMKAVQELSEQVEDQAKRIKELEN